MIFVKAVYLASYLAAGWAKSIAIPGPSADVNSTLEENPYGEPLFLTRYIEEGRLIPAREASQVPSLIGIEEVESYSGYLTVNKTHNSNLFFWFFPAENIPSQAPTVLWLQGGPGWSSMYGVLNENGPFFLTEDISLQRRAHYWTQELNMIYIDSPVGAGFSFTEDIEGYAKDETEVGRDLYVALLQFFELFPEFQKTQFFITGESYAGKYIPALAHTIHVNNPSADLKINLKGFAIGDGWVDPRNMMVYSKYLYEHGLIDDNVQAAMKEIELNTMQLIDQNDFHGASAENEKILALLKNVSGPIDEYNYLIAGYNSPETSNISGFFTKQNVRRSLHVGNLTYYSKSDRVEELLYDDVTKSVAPWLEELMDQYRVLLYSGQLDIIVAYPLTINFVRKLKWSGAEEYLKAPRKQWHVGQELAGFVKTVKNFTEILVRNAGHMVPADQPIWALDLITRFTKNIPFDRLIIN